MLIIECKIQCFKASEPHLKRGGHYLNNRASGVLKMDNLIGDICFKLNAFFNENEAKHLATQQSIIKAAFQHNDETLQELKAKYASLLETNQQLNERIKVLKTENSISKILDENKRLHFMEENARMIQFKYDEIWNAILKRETRSMRKDCVKPQVVSKVELKEDVKVEDMIVDQLIDHVELKDTSIELKEDLVELKDTIAKLQDEIADPELVDDTIELKDDIVELVDTNVELNDEIAELNVDLNELEETEIELYETTINNKTYYVDNEKNIYEQLPDDEIGEIIGHLDDHNELILN